MDTTLLQEGLIIMSIGMGTVFFFLTIMIYAMRLNEIVLKFVNKYFPEEIIEIKSPKKKVESSDDEIALAIVCAVQRAS